jgi:hypothetical protein
MSTTLEVSHSSPNAAENGTAVCAEGTLRDLSAELTINVVDPIQRDCNNRGHDSVHTFNSSSISEHQTFFGEIIAEVDEGTDDIGNRENERISRVESRSFENEIKNDVSGAASAEKFNSRSVVFCKH